MLVALCALAAPSEAATRYASPTAPALLTGGTAGLTAGNNAAADCQSSSSGFCTLARAIALSVSGDSVALKCGNATARNPMWFKGANDMIAPAANKSGVTVRAETGCEGKILVDAEFASSRRPVALRSSNSNWVIQDINLRNGYDALISIDFGSSNNVVRRVVGWDMRADIYSGLIAVHHSSTNNLFEDVAVFGVAAKTVTMSQGGSNFTCRRCWIRWEGNMNSGSALGITTAYNSQSALLENSLITHDGISQPQTYTSVGNQAVNFTNYGTYQSTFVGIDRIDCAADPVSPCPPKEANAKVYGSISYVPQSARLTSTNPSGTPSGYFPIGLWQTGASNLTVRDFVSVIANGHSRFNDFRPFTLDRCPQNGPTIGTCTSNPVVGNTAQRITSLGGNSNVFHSDWSVTNTSVGNCVTGSSQNPCTGGNTTAVQTPWQNTSTNGARICYRSTNGVVDTSSPLWPWPMNDRIKDATSYAGAYNLALGCPGCTYSGAGPTARTETDVTAQIEALLGVIPSTCRVGAVVTPVLTVSPSSLTFNATAGQANPANQTFTITDTAGTGNLQWSVSDNASWLSVASASGTGNASPAVSVDTAGLAAGTYNGTITITSSNGSGSPKTIAVTLNLSAAPIVPALSVTPTSMTFNTSEGVNPPSLTFLLDDTANAGTMTWTISSTATWSTPTPSSGTDDRVVTVSVNVNSPTVLTPGTYFSTITVSAPGATGTPKTVDLVLNVLATSAPGTRHGGRVR